MSSGASVESFTSPLKLLEKDVNTGEYIVRMSPQDFDRLSNQNWIATSETDTRYCISIKLKMKDIL